MEATVRLLRRSHRPDNISAVVPVGRARATVYRRCPRVRPIDPLSPGQGRPPSPPPATRTACPGGGACPPCSPNRFQAFLRSRSRSAARSVHPAFPNTSYRVAPTCGSWPTSTVDSHCQPLGGGRPDRDRRSYSSGGLMHLLSTGRPPRVPRREIGASAQRLEAPRRRGER